MDIEDARVKQSQLSLFPMTSRNVCESIGLNWLSAIELYNTGFLSFDPCKNEKLNEIEETELMFLGSLVVGGCDQNMLESLLSKLKKNYQYSINEIYYSWLSREWRFFPKETEFDNQSIFEEWIYELESEKDIEQLEELQDLIKSALINVKET